MPKSNAFRESAWALLLQGEIDALGTALGITNAGAATDIYAGLHSAQPLDSDTQDANETALGRAAIPREDGSWLLVNGEATLNTSVVFGANTTGSPIEVAAWSIGTGSSGATPYFEASPLLDTSPKGCTMPGGSADIIVPNHGLTVGERVAFVGVIQSSIPIDLTEGVPYYVVASPDSGTIQVSATSGGTAITVGAGHAACARVNVVTVPDGDDVSMPSGGVVLAESTKNADSPIPPGSGGTLQNFVQSSAFVHGGDIRLTFDTDVLVGEYGYEGSGRYWVMNPTTPSAGVTVVSKIPAFVNNGPYTATGETHDWHAHGMSKDVPIGRWLHAFDSTYYIGVPGLPTWQEQYYLSAQNEARKLVEEGPQTYVPGTCLIPSRSRTTPGNPQQTHSMMFVHVVDSIPAAGAFAPCYLGGTSIGFGLGASPPPYSLEDIDIAAKFPQLDKTRLDTTYTFADVAALINGPLYEGMHERNVRRYGIPWAKWTDYGADVVAHLMPALCYLCLDVDLEDKKKVLYHLIQIGLDRYTIGRNMRWPNQGLPASSLWNAGFWYASAGHITGAKTTMMIAGYALEDEDILSECERPTNIFSPKQFYEEDTQFFVVQDVTTGENQGPNYGVCGYGPVPAGGSGSWIDVGQPEWGINHWPEVGLKGVPDFDMSAFNPDDPGNASHPKVNGIACTKTSTNYRTCCSATVYGWITELFSRIIQSHAGSGNFTDRFYHPAIYYYMRDRVRQECIAWGIPILTTGFRERRGTSRLPVSLYGYMPDFWLEFDPDYQDQLPALTEPYSPTPP